MMYTNPQATEIVKAELESKMKSDPSFAAKIKKNRQRQKLVGAH